MSVKVWGESCQPFLAWMAFHPNSQCSAVTFREVDECSFRVFHLGNDASGKHEKASARVRARLKQADILPHA